MEGRGRRERKDGWEGRVEREVKLAAYSILEPPGKLGSNIIRNI